MDSCNSTSEFDRNVWKCIQSDALAAFHWVLRHSPLSFNPSWNISSKAVSEIGGRLIEDWLSANFEQSLRTIEQLGGSQCNAMRNIPVAGRSIGDIELKFVIERCSYTLYIRIMSNNTIARDETYRFYQKHGIKKPRPGKSHPNLIAFERAVDFFNTASNISSDIAIFYCRYSPIQEGTQVRFDFTKTLRCDSDSLFLLRDISEKNLSPVGNLGKGQLQMKGLSEIGLKPRTRKEFLQVLSELVAAKASKK
jgi:hypothetical protein